MENYLDHSELTALKPSFLMLDNQRRINFNIYGDNTSDKTIVYCHNAPGSRLEGSLFHNLCHDKKLRLIALDRPGIGHSTISDELSVINAARDIKKVINDLKIERFTLLAWGSGAPSALLCAAAMVDKVVDILLCSPHLESFIDESEALRLRTSVQSTLNIPALKSSAYNNLLNNISGKTDKYYLHLYSLLPSSDREAILFGENEEWYSDNIREALFQGAKNGANDSIVNSREPGFSLSDINRPVNIWLGSDDVLISEELIRVVIDSRHSQYLIKKIPDCGYFIPLSKKKEIVDHLIQGFDT